MKLVYTLTFLSLFFAGTGFAQNTNPKSASQKANRELSQNSVVTQRQRKHNKQASTGINLSLWKDVSTQKTDTAGSTFLNLGLFSSLNQLNGLGVNLLSGVVGKNANGIQLAGLANVVGQSMNGVQVAGISNINGNNLSGVSASGLVGITGNNAQGIIFSGLANISGDHTRGVILSGLLNISGERSSGLHLAGLADISGGDFQGTALAGLLSVIGEDLNGVQLAGLGNITAEDMKGIQIAGIGNLTGGTAKGVQLSPANIAIRAEGLQIGLFNYYKESLKGFQLGLVNANPHTKVQMMLFGGNTTKLNIGVRFKNKLFYTILGGGTHYLDFKDKFSAALFYRAGLELPLYKRLFISGDLGYQHIETFRNKDYGFPARLYALQARVNLEYRLTDRLGIFLTGGYGGSRYYNQAKTYDKGVIIESGVVMFKY